MACRNLFFLGTSFVSFFEKKDMLQSESWRIMFTKSEIQKESEWMTKARVYSIILTIEHEKGHLLFFQGIALTRFGKFTDILAKTRVISKKTKKRKKRKKQQRQ